MELSDRILFIDGEAIVLDGQYRLEDGAKVTVQPAAKPAAANDAAPRTDS